MDKEKNENKHVYVGNAIPTFIKIAWAILLLWIVYYLVAYMVPDLDGWLKR